MLHRVGAVVVDSAIQLFSGKSNILFLTFGTGDQIYQVCGGTREIVSDWIFNASFCTSESAAAVEVFACNTFRSSTRMDADVIGCMSW